MGFLTFYHLQTLPSITTSPILSPCILSCHFLSRPSTSSSLHVKCLCYNPYSHRTVIFLSPPAAARHHLLTFSEVNKTIICPNISFFQLHLLFWPSTSSYFSRCYSNYKFRKYLKWLPLSRLCWHVRCDPSLGVDNLVMRKGEKPVLTDSLPGVSAPAQHLLRVYPVDSLYTPDMSDTPVTQVRKLRHGEVRQLAEEHTMAGHPEGLECLASRSMGFFVVVFPVFGFLFFFWLFCFFVFSHLGW